MIVRDGHNNDIRRRGNDTAWITTRLSDIDGLEAQLADEPFSFVVYPLLHMLQPWLLPGLIQAKELFLDEPKR